MDATEYQKRAARTANSDLGNDLTLAIAALGLAGEAGEVADLVKKYMGQGHPLDRAALAEEAGDLAWYLAALCTALGLDLSDVLAGNILKLETRYPQGFSPAASMGRAQ